jgi:hypothetical protein
MFSWLEDSVNNAKKEVEKMVEETTGVNPYTDSEKDSENKEPSTKLHEPFLLPIQYLEEKEVFQLSSIVSSDLELYKKEENEKCVYQISMTPNHPFGKELYQDWNKYYTNNTQFLEESQDVISTTPLEVHSLKHELLMDMWKDCKSNKTYFLEKYGYIEWDILKSFNRSPMFLQIMSMMNMGSPVISLILPMLFLILPFLVMKLRGIPISFQDYLVVLKEVTKNHFIGRMMACFTDMNLQNLITTLLMGGLYFYQMYHNVLSCMKFYENVHRVNHYLCTLKEYLEKTGNRMMRFVELHNNKPHYKPFCQALSKHYIVLTELQSHLLPIVPVKQFIYKLGSIGYLLKCYYDIHANPDYEESLRYSFGFEGYLDNIYSIQQHVRNGSMNKVLFSSSKPTSFENQYYPFHLNEDNCVKNNCSMEKKLIVTGPNASGKTTFLKTHTINVLMCQQIGFGFFDQGILHPYTHIHSYLNIPDTSERDSLFQAESRRCKDIIDSISEFPEEEGYRHYCIFDELYSGTNPKEATKSAYAFLKYMSNYSHVDFILTTHYVSVCSKLKKSKLVNNFKMDVKKKKGKLIYEYKLKKGISKIQGAVNILEEMNYPKEILDSVKEEK